MQDASGTHSRHAGCKRDKQSSSGTQAGHTVVKRDTSGTHSCHARHKARPQTNPLPPTLICHPPPPPGTHTRMTSATGCTNIFPSPISPVNAATATTRTTTSTWDLQKREGGTVGGWMVVGHITMVDGGVTPPWWMVDGGVTPPWWKSGWVDGGPHHHGGWWIGGSHHHLRHSRSRGRL